MKASPAIVFKPVTEETISSYISTGTRAYNDHYRHLWPEGDTSPYIQHNFNTDRILWELQQDRTNLWILEVEGAPIGICKVVWEKVLQGFAAEKTLFIEKIYLINSATGKGYGTTIFDHITNMALESNKNILWLEAMQKGPALNFYQKTGFSIHSKTQIPFKEAIAKEKPMWVMLKKI